MKQIGVELGIDADTLEHYAERFQLHNITGEHLCTLTEHDLEHIGITSFGHQRKILVIRVILDLTSAYLF